MVGMTNQAFDPSDDWFEDPNISDQEKIAYIHSQPKVELYVPEGIGLVHYIKLQLLERGITPDSEHGESWLNDDSVPDEEKRQWIVGILNANA